MTTTQLKTTARTLHTPAGRGPHHLMLGTVLVSRLLDGDGTSGEFSILDVTGPAGSGPGPHLDPWRETFYVLDGELTFRVEEDGAVRSIVARVGDAVSIPQGVGHAFSVTSPTAARYLILSTPAGIAAFFADAGEPVDRAVAPDQPRPFDRDRLQAAFVKHGLRPYQFPGERGTASATCE